MLIAGTDVSGIPEFGEQLYVSLVVGTEEAIRDIHNNTGVKKIHMVRLDESEKNNVITSLDFCRNDVSAWCFYVERQNIVNNIFHHPRLKRKPGSKEKIYAEFDKIFLKCFRHELNNFCLQHGEEIGKLAIESDSDMSQAVRRWSFVNKKEGKAHEIADAIAWCNSHDIKLKGCREVNFADEINSKLTASMIR